jgi:hypothetical protein
VITLADEVAEQLLASLDSGILTTGASEAVTRLVAKKGAIRQPDFELGGPQIFTYEELLRTIARNIGARTKFGPMPFALWHALGRISEHVPGAPLTRNQIELMEQDTVTSPERPGLPELAIEPPRSSPVVLKIERPSVRAYLASPSACERFTTASASASPSPSWPRDLC